MNIVGQSACMFLPSMSYTVLTASFILRTYSYTSHPRPAYSTYYSPPTTSLLDLLLLLSLEPCFLPQPCRPPLHRGIGYGTVSQPRWLRRGRRRLSPRRHPPQKLPLLAAALFAGSHRTSMPSRPCGTTSKAGRTRTSTSERSSACVSSTCEGGAEAQGRR